VKKESLEIDDEFIDSVVDEVVKSMKHKAEKLTEGQKKAYWEEIVKLRSRVATLENRVEKYISSFKTNSVENVRNMSQISEELSSESEKQILDLQTQLEALRTAMIRLSSEVRKIKESAG
jgi:predicted secreted protein